MNSRAICAVSKIKGSDSYPDLHGNVYFRQRCSGVMVTAEIYGLPCNDPNMPEVFGFHVHAKSSCTGNSDDPFADAGAHYNPANSKHPFHKGDLPPLFGNHGYAYMSVFTDRFTVREIIGRTVIIHRNVDDFTSQPSGNSGEKIACGEIMVKG